MADLRMPVTHRLGRAAVLAVVAALIAAAVWTGLVMTVVDWTTGHITGVITEIWGRLAEADR